MEFQRQYPLDLAPQTVNAELVMFQITILERKLPIPEQIKIGDFACAQGNISLILAELSYKVLDRKGSLDE